MTKINLCGNGHCPSVELLNNKALIEENDNTVELTTEEWNSLVEKIETGKLTKISS